MLPGYLLDKNYQRLESSSPKLEDIAKILAKHQAAPVLIMSSFPEMTLVVERVRPPQL